MLLPRVDNRKYFAVLLLALVALAWLALILWGQSPYARFLDHEQLDEVYLAPTGELAGVMLVFVVGWTVMTVAMMLPTSLPLFSLFQRVVQQRPDGTLLVAILITGYLAIWSLFGFLALAGDLVVHAVVEQFSWLDENSWVLGAGVLLTAGVYQFTPLKYVCLDKCRSPLSFITEHWHGTGEQVEAFKLGVHHGLFCLGCCWSLMLLMFVVGMGSVGWMLVLGAVMAVERNMSWGRRLSTPLGVVLIASAVAVALFTVPVVSGFI